MTIASLVACPLAGGGLALDPVLFDPKGRKKVVKRGMKRGVKRVTRNCDKEKNGGSDEGRKDGRGG